MPAPPQHCVSRDCHYICANRERGRMSVNPARSGVPKSAEPVVHELPSIRVGGADLPVRLATWRAEDGTWRGRLMFGSGEGEGPSTAGHFFAATGNDLWQSGRDLRAH